MRCNLFVEVRKYLKDRLQLETSEAVHFFFFKLLHKVYILSVPKHKGTTVAASISRYRGDKSVRGHVSVL